MKHQISFRVFWFCASLVLILVFALPGGAETPPEGYWARPFVTDLGFATAIDFAPDGTMYVADTTSKHIEVYDIAGKRTDRIPIPVDVPRSVGQVLGVALDPDFPNPPIIYIHYLDKIAWSNVVIRLTREGGETSNVVELANIPLPPNPDDPDTPCTDHNGGHLAFAPGGALLMGMGDNCQGELVDDLSKPQGTILRMDRMTGEGLPGNPYYGDDGKDERIWAKGLRNPFGLTFDPVTRYLWSSDNGPGCADEVNRIFPGRHYGWPHSSPDYFTCIDPGSEFVAPSWVWDETFGPTGIVAYTGPIESWQDSLFACDWSDGHLRRLQLDDERKNILSEHIIEIPDVLCRTDVKIDPDGRLYIVDTKTIYQVVFNVPHWLPVMLRA